MKSKGNEKVRRKIPNYIELSIVSDIKYSNCCLIIQKSLISDPFFPLQVRAINENKFARAKNAIYRCSTNFGIEILLRVETFWGLSQLLTKLGKDEIRKHDIPKLNDCF